MAIEVDDGSGPRRQAAKLNVDAMQALSKGNAVVSAQLLEQAVAIDGTNVGLWLNLAAARRAAAMFGDALKAVDAALAIDPRGFLALLMKASLLERLGDRRQAATQYGHALAVAPREDLLDPPTRKALAHAQAVSAQNSKELAIFIRERLNQKQSPASASAASRRVDRFVDLLTGQKRHYPQQPSSFFYPDQPAIEFWERDEFPWLNDLEQSAPAIREELLQVVGDTGSFTPYIEYPDGIPLDQWTELNHSPRWSAFHFYHYGRRYEENCRRCPQTVEVLTSLPQPKVQGRMPAAMFSVLRPKTHIPAHTGVANVRLVVHLPLVVPSGCRFRVGNEMREWKPGQAWVFDDTIEHEAWNDGDQDRVILICDVWNPRLSEGEREAIAELMTALDDFNGVENPPMSI